MINWKVRMKNPLFWVSLGGVILTAMGRSPETFTSWARVLQAAVELVKNPYLLGSVSLAVLGVLLDPTTEGICDSWRAMNYEKPEGGSK